jgi:hypothetical protein
MLRRSLVCCEVMPCDERRSRTRHVPHAPQLAGDQLRRWLGHDAHREIDRALHQLLDVVVEDHVQRDLRMPLHELRQPDRHAQLPVAAGHAQADHSLQALAEAAHGFGRGLHLVAYGTPVLVQLHAQLGGFQLARGPSQQLRTEFTLEAVDPLAHVGPAHAQHGGGLAQVAGFDDVDQQAQGLNIHCQFQIYINVKKPNDCKFSGGGK